MKYWTIPACLSILFVSFAILIRTNNVIFHEDLREFIQNEALLSSNEADSLNITYVREIIKNSVKLKAKPSITAQGEHIIFTFESLYKEEDIWTISLIRENDSFRVDNIGGIKNYRKIITCD